MERTSNTTFLISDLLGARIVSAEGEMLGHVRDIQLSSGPEYTVTALMYGPGGFFHHLHLLNPFRKGRPASSRPDTVPWQAVASFEQPIVKLKPGFKVRK